MHETIAKAIADSSTSTPRLAIAIVAMHAELSSQGPGVDWSDRPDELAETVVAYADTLIQRLAPPDARKG